MCRRAVVLVVAFAAPFAAGCAPISPVVPVVHDAVYTATGLVVILLENQNGAVNMTGWDRTDECEKRNMGTVARA